MVTFATFANMRLTTVTCFWTICRAICPSHSQFASPPLLLSLSLLQRTDRAMLMVADAPPIVDDEGEGTEETEDRSRSRQKRARRKRKDKRARMEQDEERGGLNSPMALGPKSPMSPMALATSGRRELPAALGVGGSSASAAATTLATSGRMVVPAALSVGGSSASAAAPALLGLAPQAEVKKKETKEAQNAAGGGKGFSKDQKKLITLMMKQILQSQQQNREFASILFDVFLVPSASPIAVAASRQGQQYAKAVAAPGHGLGSPHLCIFGSVLNALETDKKNFTVYESMTPEMRGETIKLCKMVSTFKETHKKLVLSWGVGEHSQALRRDVVSKMGALEGWTMKQGKAPAGHMERELSKWLADMVA